MIGHHGAILKNLPQEKAVLWAHPVLMILAVAAAVHVLWLGLERTLSLHLDVRQRFRRARHIGLGSSVLVVFLAGMAGGTLASQHVWHLTGVTGVHRSAALAMVPFVVFGLGSGLLLMRAKKPRKTLAILHGLCNFVLLCLAFWQVRTGWFALRDYVM